jgi:L-fuconolactonase
VGWIDMLARDAVAMLEELSTNNILRGIRPMLQDIVGDDWVLQDVLIPVFQSLIDLQLTFDALIFPRHLKHIIRLVERFPDLKIVIDHGAKPLIAKNHFEPWAKELALLAEHKNVFCKLSGLVTAAGEGWTKKQMLPYMDHIIQCFGSDRIMWGSDWPVLTLVSHYQDWYRFCGDYVAENKLDATAIFGRTAQKFYNLVS